MFIYSKSEWHQAKVKQTTTRVVQGGADVLREQQQQQQQGRVGRQGRMGRQGRPGRKDRAVTKGGLCRSPG